VQESGYNGIDPTYSGASDLLSAETAWRDPGFEQGPDHPVVGVNWRDARMFCQWLTEKERKIVATIVAANGASNKALAARLFITEHTLRNHLTSIYQKLGVVNRLELYVYAVKHGMGKAAN